MPSPKSPVTHSLWRWRDGLGYIRFHLLIGRSLSLPRNWPTHHEGENPRDVRNGGKSAHAPERRSARGMNDGIQGSSAMPYTRVPGGATCVSIFCLEGQNLGRGD